MIYKTFRSEGELDSPEDIPFSISRYPKQTKIPSFSFISIKSYPILPLQHYRIILFNMSPTLNIQIWNYSYHVQPGVVVESELQTRTNVVGAFTARPTAFVAEEKVVFEDVVAPHFGTV